MGAHGHSKSDFRHWRLHDAALHKLRDHPELVPAVLALLNQWLMDECLRESRPCLRQWLEMLTAWPFVRLCEAVLAFERGQQLRQCSPLGPVLTPQERWAVLAEAERLWQERAQSAQDESSAA